MTCTLQLKLYFNIILQLIFREQCVEPRKSDFSGKLDKYILNILLLLVPAYLYRLQGSINLI